MYELLLTTTSALQTQNFGFELGKAIISPAYLALTGELGVGKTCLAQGIMKGLGVRELYLTSPSYTLVNQYQTPKGVIFHCDLYRLDTLEQAEELVQEECLDRDGIVLIEWAEKIISRLSLADFLHVKLVRIDDETRQIKIVSHGEHHCQILHRLDLSSII